MIPQPFDPDDETGPDEDADRPWAARAIRHPSHARTRAHFAANPLPVQQGRRAS